MHVDRICEKDANVINGTSISKSRAHYKADCEKFFYARARSRMADEKEEKKKENERARDR